MRIITLEEHVTYSEMANFLPKDNNNGFEQSPAIQRVAGKLEDVTGERLQSMDETGITMQVLSVNSSGANQLGSKEAVTYCKRYNDLTAAKISGYKDRFAAFANLPMNEPQAAADELERVVNAYHFKGAMIMGLVDGQFLDHPKFAPVFERAERLDVPIYLHPGFPPKNVADAYYSNVGGQPGMMQAIACYGWGWHSETALHVLRLLVAGVFDKYPKLQLIIGHMGEMLPMMMVRSDNVLKPGNGGANQRSLIETFKKQVHITTSGLFTQPPLRIALDTFGIDNIMFSVDYPFSSNRMGIDFLNAIDLPKEAIEKIAHGNAEKLLKLM